MVNFTIMREKRFGGGAQNHNVFLDNVFVGTLSNGGVLRFSSDISGTHTLTFKPTLKTFLKESYFTFTVNGENDNIALKTYISFGGDYKIEYL